MKMPEVDEWLRSWMLPQLASAVRTDERNAQAVREFEAVKRMCEAMGKRKNEQINSPD